MQDNNSVNFIVKGITSILIGIYFFIGSYLIQNFLVDDSLANLLSLKSSKIFITIIVLLIFAFSSSTLYCIGKRASKKSEIILWNSKTKIAFWKYLIGVITISFTLLIVENQGFIDYLTPTFLVLYGILLLILKNKERKNLMILSGLCTLLAFICLLIPNYWYSSFAILGVAHITYGVVVK